MSKSKILNIVMICVIAVILVGGLLTVGFVQGWFDHDDGSAAMLSSVRGLANMEREGIAYQAKENTVLRTGDRITCDAGTVVTVTVGESRLELTEQAVLEIRDASAASFHAAVLSGEVFADAREPVHLSFEDNDLTLQDCVAHLSIRTGTQTLSVFRGQVGDTAAGQQTDWLDTESATREIAIASLNPFTISQLRKSNEGAATCFNNEALDRLEEDRRIQMQEQLNSTNPTVNLDGVMQEPTETTEVPVTETTVPEATEPVQTEAPETEPAETEPAETEPVQTEAPETEPAETEPPETEPDVTKYVTLTIRCDTILENWDNLEPSKAPYVPADGVILYPTQVAFTEGETVFDVLKRACDAYGIQIEYSFTPMYDAYYVEGLHNLYEFDCGSESGWMYKVNEWFPNYGCSKYILEEGDDIVWCYTCNGLGADVGGSVY